MTPTLKTERLVLRPFRPGEAAAVARHAGDWEVARMLARVPHPYTRAMAEEWIAAHGPLQRSGEEFVFCIEFDGAMIGAVGLQRRANGAYELGYWLGQAWWGRGFATEAALRAVRWAFEDLGARSLVSGHLADNPASGRVLEKCGFRYTGDSRQHSMARGGPVAHRDFAIDRADRSASTRAS